MATTIKLKTGSGAPLNTDLVQGEPAIDLTNKRLYTENGTDTVIEIGTNPTEVTTGDLTATGTVDLSSATVSNSLAPSCTMRPPRSPTNVSGSNC